MYLEGRKYGYLTKEKAAAFIKTVPNQQVAGYPIGIIYIEDVNYPLIPGNVVNASTYDFPVLMKPVKGLNSEMLYRADNAVRQTIIDTAKHLVECDGVRAISGACGFFGNYQRDVAAAVDVPVALSPLIQIPWVRALIKPGQKIGVLTASGRSLTKELLNSCGVDTMDDIVIADLEYAPEFSVVNDMRGYFDNEIACQEVTDAAVKLIHDNEDVGAIVLECSDMPPYSADIQAATQLPVFDFITMIKWMHSTVCQKPYAGWI